MMDIKANYDVWHGFQDTTPNMAAIVGDNNFREVYAEFSTAGLDSFQDLEDLRGRLRLAKSLLNVQQLE